MDSQYLKETVGDALIESLSCVLDKQPTDPIEYLGLMLLQYIKNKEGDPAHFPKRDFKYVQMTPKSVVKQVELNINTKEIVVRDEVTEKLPLLEETRSEQVEKAEPHKKKIGNNTSEEPTVDQIDNNITPRAKEMDEVVLGVDVDINESNDLIDKATSEDVDKAPLEQMTGAQVTPAGVNTTANEPIIKEVKESESDAKGRTLPPQEDLTENQSTPSGESQSIPVETTD